MRRGVVIVSLVLLVAAGSARGADRAWVLRAGGGPLYPSADQGELLGRAFAVEVAKPLRPWFTLGLEAAWLHVDGSTLYGWNTYTQVDPWNTAIVTARVRLQAPARTGPAPFVEASNGVSMPWGGGAEYRTYFGSGSWYSVNLPEASSLQWVSSVGVGLRIVLPGRWPDPEVAVRRHLWDGGHVQRVVEPRVALGW